MSANNQSMTRQVEQDRRILELLSQSFPNAAAASTEIINLEAILNLPKGTEHFVADIHGEHEAFQHILKNASGTIKRKIKERYDETLTKEEIRELCTLIYYPEEKLELVTAAEDDLTTWYETTLFRLIEVCRIISSKYTRSKVRKALPQEFAYILEELLHENAEDKDKGDYIHRIIETVISTEQAGNIIKALCHVIQRLAIDQLHILGDVFDRGPGAHLIMDMLLDYKNFDIQWGNHDALWMGAAAGNDCCIMNVLRLSLRFGNMATLEDGYGINLVPLATFAMEQYGDDPCCEFMPKLAENQHAMDEKEQLLLARMHKAVSILQFKLEEQMTEAHPDWVMERIGTLHHIRPEEGVYELDGKTYAMSSCHFPTVDWKQPYALTEAEEDLRRQLHHSFRVSEKLQRHVKCLFEIPAEHMPLQSGSQHTDIAGRKIQAVRIFQHDPEITPLLRGHLVIAGSLQRFDMCIHFTGCSCQRTYRQFHRDAADLPFSGNCQRNGDGSCLYRIGIIFTVEVLVGSVQEPERFSQITVYLLQRFSPAEHGFFCLYCFLFKKVKRHGFLLKLVFSLFEAVVSYFSSL